MKLLTTVISWRSRLELNYQLTKLSTIFFFQAEMPKSYHFGFVVELLLNKLS